MSADRGPAAIDTALELVAAALNEYDGQHPRGRRRRTVEPHTTEPADLRASGFSHGST